MMTQYPQLHGYLSTITAVHDGILAIKEAPFLSDGQKRDILCNNATRSLRLEGQIETDRGAR